VTVTATAPPRRAVTGFGRWVAESLPQDARVLNIGAGSNKSGDLKLLRQRAAHVVGIDQSPRIHQNKHVDERHQQSLELFAADHADEFDLAFSVFVLEHVRDPEGFAAACARVLKPGGTLMGLTVNAWHYFGALAWAATRLGVSEWLLPRVRPDLNTEEYHHPTHYRLNTIPALTRRLDEAGFRTAEFRMWDLPRLYTPYLPRPLRGVASMWQRGVYRWHEPRLMGHLTFKATL
jgi:SAM-dependent methyltransferase